jgi:hypothetical protein
MFRRERWRHVQQQNQLRHRSSPLFLQFDAAVARTECEVQRMTKKDHMNDDGMTHDEPGA